MKGLFRVLLACSCFFGVALTGLLLILLEWIAKPLRYANIRCLAELATIHAREIRR